MGLRLLHVGLCPGGKTQAPSIPYPESIYHWHPPSPSPPPPTTSAHGICPRQGVGDGVRRMVHSGWGWAAARAIGTDWHPTQPIGTGGSQPHRTGQSCDPHPSSRESPLTHRCAIHSVATFETNLDRGPKVESDTALSKGRKMPRRTPTELHESKQFVVGK